MRNQLLSWFPEDLRGRRILDAGCGTGAIASILAERGAQVIAVDLSLTLVTIAKARTPSHIKQLNIDSPLSAGPGIFWHAGDLLDPSLGNFTDVISMDCLIHYSRQDCLTMLGALAARTSQSVVFTFAPGNPLLIAALALGRLFPRKDRSPNIQPVLPTDLFKGIASEAPLKQWKMMQTQRIRRGFYTSQAVQLVHA
jgi:magnesium-protoporphyrin O-methyltransferase